MAEANVKLSNTLNLYLKYKVSMLRKFIQTLLNNKYIHKKVLKSVKT